MTIRVKLNLTDEKSAILSFPDGTTVEQMKAKAQQAKQVFQQQQGSSLRQGAVFGAEQAIKTSPLGLASRGAANVQAGLGRTAGFLNKAGFKLPSQIQEAARFPAFLGRSAGVALSQAQEPAQTLGLPGTRPQDIVQRLRAARERGGAALQPDFKPESPREAIFGAAGEAAPFVAAGTALGPLAAGTVFGGLVASKQAATEGRFSPILPALAIATPFAINRFAKFFAGRDAIKAQRTIEQAAGDLSQTYRKFAGEATSNYQAVRNNLGVVETTVEANARVLRFGDKMSLRQVFREFNKITDPQAVTRKTGLLTVKGKELQAIDQPVILKPIEKLKQLSILEDQLSNKHINWGKISSTKDAFKKWQQVKDQIKSLGDEGRSLAETSAAYAQFKKVAARLAEQVTDTDIAVSLLNKLAKGIVKKQFAVTTRKDLAALRLLSAKTGKQFLDPAVAVFKQQLAPRTFGQRLGGAAEDIAGAVSPRLGFTLRAARKAIR